MTFLLLTGLKAADILGSPSLAGTRLVCEISTNINTQLEVTFSPRSWKAASRKKEHSWAHQRSLEGDQQGTDYHPSLPLMKAAARWRLTNSTRAAKWGELEIDTSRWAKCANQFSEGREKKREAAQITHLWLCALIRNTILFLNGPCRVNQYFDMMWQALSHYILLKHKQMCGITRSEIQTSCV